MSARCDEEHLVLGLVDRPSKWNWRPSRLGGPVRRGHTTDGPRRRLICCCVNVVSEVSFDWDNFRTPAEGSRDGSNWGRPCRVRTEPYTA